VEKFSLEMRQHFLAARLSRADCGLASGLCIIRFGILKEFPSNFGENLSSLSVSAGRSPGCRNAQAAAEGSELQARSTIPFLLPGYARMSLLPRAKSNARAAELAHAQRVQSI